MSNSQHVDFDRSRETLHTFIERRKIMAIALNTVIVDGQEYKPGDAIPDFKSIKCVDTREPRKYQGLSADVSVLNDVIAKYASGGASCFMSDTGEYYEYDREEKWKLITNITERGFDSEKAYGALKHMLNLKNEVIDTSVKSWLAEHPEATTTVQDGSIEEIKINKNFLPWIKKDYVTPEMFGAVGDGIIDDSNAMLSAVATGLPIRGGKGKKYAIKSELVFRDNCDISSIHIIANAKIECVIKYSKRNTRIHNIQIDCNDLADYGILGASDTPMDALYFASIKNCSVYNALIDGYNTGMVRTFINDCIAKKCANAGFYIGTSDTKHDNLVPIDCKYGVYVNSGNTSINRFHPWSWEKEQIGLFVETSRSVSIGYYFNDTNQCAISFSAGADITIGTLRNFNNTSAPSAISEGCRMLTKNEDGQTYIPYITIGTICGSFSGFDDYFLYPNNYDINYMSVQRINLINVNTRFDKKMFRLSYVPVSLYNKVLEKFSIISDILTITSCSLQKCETDLNGYKIRIEVEFEHSNAKLEPLNDILNIQYIGTDTSTAYYRILNASASHTALSFHSTRKTNDDNKLKGMGLRCNNPFTLNGV